MTDKIKLPADVERRFNEKFPGKFSTICHVRNLVELSMIIDRKEVKQFLADELAKAREEERNAILKDIIEKGGFTAVQEGVEYSCDVICRPVLAQ